MPKHGKNFTEAKSKIEAREYDLGEAIKTVREVAPEVRDQVVESLAHQPVGQCVLLSLVLQL